MVNFAAETRSLDLGGQQVVVLGGSNGIGKGIARFYASKGASVLILGHTPSAGQAVLAELQSITNTNSKTKGSDSEKQRVSFIQGDLSLVKGIYKAVDDIKEWAGAKGIQYLFQSQGRWLGPPTADGIEPGFAVQVLSRFALSYILSEEGVLKEGSTVMLVAGGGKHGNARPIMEDLDLQIMSSKKTPSIPFRRKHMTSIIDIYTKELSLRYPGIRFFHVFPGQVKSELIKRADEIPLILRYIAEAIFHIPGVARTPDQYAPIAAYTISVAAKNRDDLCWGSNGRAVTLCATAEEEQVRKELWERLVGMLEAHK